MWHCLQMVALQRIIHLIYYHTRHELYGVHRDAGFDPFLSSVWNSREEKKASLSVCSRVVRGVDWQLNAFCLISCDL